jgi:hypothetical protein
MIAAALVLSYLAVFGPSLAVLIWGLTKLAHGPLPASGDRRAIGPQGNRRRPAPSRADMRTCRHYSFAARAGRDGLRKNAGTLPANPPLP